MTQIDQLNFVLNLNNLNNNNLNNSFHFVISIFISRSLCMTRIGQLNSVQLRDANSRRRRLQVETCRHVKRDSVGEIVRVNDREAMRARSRRVIIVRLFVSLFRAQHKDSLSLIHHLIYYWLTGKRRVHCATFRHDSALQACIDRTSRSIRLILHRGALIAVFCLPSINKLRETSKNVESRRF